MDLTLNYIYPHNQAIVIKTRVPVDQGDWYDTWLDTMVKMDEEVIFFYTIETTDIWKD